MLMWILKSPRRRPESEMVDICVRKSEKSERKEGFGLGEQ